MHSSPFFSQDQGWHTRQNPLDCMDDDSTPSLPAIARLPINRCNLPAVILGSLAFQEHPAPLFLDHVLDLHRDLWRHLDSLPCAKLRAGDFMAWMRGHFCLDDLAACGLGADGRRGRADYLRLLRGWMFSPDGREAAVLKGWVESRFGLMTRFHRQPMPHPETEAYARFMHERTAGLYNTNALEAQLDLLFSYCQYELGRRFPGASHLLLHRGINGLERHDWLEHGAREAVVLMNNINAFSAHREHADTFGDCILSVWVPVSKIFCFTGLLPGILPSEGEYLVLGGVYRVRLDRS